MNLPPSWTIAQIGQLISLNPKNSVPDDTVVGFVPMQLVGTAYRSPVRFQERTWGEVKKGFTHFADGDVLLAKITPCFENGKSGVVAGLPGGCGAGSSEYFVCRPKPGLIEARYLHAFFKTPEFRRGGEVRMTGSVGHKRVPKEYLQDSEIPLPPLSEQRRIADKLDAVLARVDACRTRLARVRAILKRFRQAVLVAATSGVLTEDWRVEQSEQQWTETDIQSIASVGTGSTPLRSNPEFYGSSGTPWITSAATSLRLVTGASEYVTEQAIVAHRLKVYPVGTLLVAMYGEGKTRGQVTELGIRATINQACAAVIVDAKRALTDYVKLVLKANYLEMRELAEGGNQPNLNLAKIKEFRLPLPSLAEQAEIVRRVESLFAWADRLEAGLAAASRYAERLAPSFLNKAFRGELVPQNPGDEPAEALLARLRACSPRPV